MHGEVAIKYPPLATNAMPLQTPLIVLFTMAVLSELPSTSYTQTNYE
jgi:hypothetical protein